MFTKNPTPPLSCKYGAPLGRPSAHPGDMPESRVSLRRVRINGGGYDAGGAYWGIGAPLWCAMDDGAFTDYLRAATRTAAKAALTARFPDIKFYR